VKDLEGGGHNLISGRTNTRTWRGWEKPPKPLVIVTNVWTQFWTQHIKNMLKYPAKNGDDISESKNTTVPVLNYKPYGW